MILTDQPIESKPDISDNVSGEGKTNGHGTSPRDKLDNKSDESEEETSTAQTQKTNGQDTTEKESAESVAKTTDDADKSTTKEDSDTIARRRKSFVIDMTKCRFDVYYLF